MPNRLVMGVRHHSGVTSPSGQHDQDVVVKLLDDPVVPGTDPPLGLASDPRPRAFGPGAAGRGMRADWPTDGTTSA